MPLAAIAARHDLRPCEASVRSVRPRRRTDPIAIQFVRHQTRLTVHANVRVMWLIELPARARRTAGITHANRRRTNAADNKRQQDGNAGQAQTPAGVPSALSLVARTAKEGSSH